MSLAPIKHKRIPAKPGKLAYLRLYYQANEQIMKQILSTWLGMDIWQKTRWYVIQTKPYQERIAATRLEQMEIEVFLPRFRQEQDICGTSRWVTSPLFLGYFFARFCPLTCYNTVRYLPSVLRVVGTRQFPIPVPDEMIASLRAQIQPDGFFSLETKPFQVGDKVTVDQGQFAGWAGQVVRELNDGKRVLILLDMVQQTCLEVQKRWVSLAEE